LPSIFSSKLFKGVICLSSLRLFWEMQNLEEKKLNMEKQLKAIPEAKELKRLKEDIEGRQDEIRNLKDELSRLKKTLKEEEDGLSMLTDKIQKAGLELYSGEITNVKELEAAEKNINVTREKAARVEEKILELMDKIENGEERVRGLLKRLEEAKTQFRRLKEVYDNKKASLAQALNEIAEQLDDLERKVSPEHLAMYLELCRKFDDSKGVALLQKGVCSGCHMTVSFDLIKLSRSGSRDVFCDNCGRLLVVE